MVRTSNQCFHCNHRHSSYKWQPVIIVCFCYLINTLIQLWHHKLMVKLFYFMNRLPKHNCYWLRCYHRKEGKFIICFDQKLFIQIDCFYFFEQHKVIVCVILTIYLYWFLFPFSNIWFKTILRCHYIPSSLQL